MTRPAQKTDTAANPPTFARLAAALKLPSDATEDDMIAALMALLERVARVSIQDSHESGFVIPSACGRFWG